MGKAGLWEGLHARWHCMQANVTRVESTVEVKRIEGRSFKSKKKAEQNGLELCKSWIDKRP
jgi:hypothetical protein